ncbi:hypothetical protein [Gloeothece verrucosa]|uniref:Uncharacterized protein n=1 Tax=Gloeothece verrucosa (strain PCC 7822) TaxID=497965 RepID=E0UMN7_GLOV7|nr:hypothetical protein [Gloeothece verrucosa]ADN18217.1 conserved hypothetical protein [Gloeothece verrucosa PCC 7822]
MNNISRKRTIFSRLAGGGIKWTPIFSLASLFLQLIAILLLMFQGAAVVAVSNKPAPTLVELADGRAISVRAIASRDRSADAIDRFVRSAMTGLFSWSGKTLNSQGQLIPDKGVEFAKGLTITEPALIASFALADNYRPILLREIAGQIPGDVFLGKTQIFLDIKHLTDAQKVGEGKWVVEMLANLLTFDENHQIGAGITFNKKVFLKAIDPPFNLMPKTPLEERFFELRSSGLEIELIKELI